MLPDFVARGLGRRPVVCAIAAALFFGCGDDPADVPDTVPTTAADTDDRDGTAADTTDDTTDPVDTADPGDTTEPDGADDGVDPPVRTLIAAPPLDGLPVDNRVIEPWFSLTASWAAFPTNASTEVHRLVLPDGPTPAPIARIGGAGSGFVMWVQLGDGQHDVSVWLGADDDGAAVLADATVTISSLDGTFDLTADPTARHVSQVPSVVGWQLFSGAVTGRPGPALLAFEPPPGARLYVTAPTVRLADGSGGSSRNARRRVEGTRERALWRAASERLRDAPAPPLPHLVGGRP